MQYVGCKHYRSSWQRLGGENVPCAIRNKTRQLRGGFQRCSVQMVGSSHELLVKSLLFAPNPGTASKEGLWIKIEEAEKNGQDEVCQESSELAGVMMMMISQPPGCFAFFQEETCFCFKLVDL